MISAGLLLGLTIAWILEPCWHARGTSPETQISGGDMANNSDQNEIRAVLERFVEAWNAMDAERAALVYTDLHFDVNATPQEETRQATVEKFEQYYRQFETQISVTSDEVIVLGDYAVQRGEFILKSTPRTGGASTAARRRYVEVLKKDAKGDWAVYWGIDGPLAGAPSPEKSE
jgi:uncharacterized protein (TIGR02246 family)